MADPLDWPIEAIPDVDSVFMRAHRIHFSNGELQPGAFREQQGGMSVDWEKYSTPEQTLQRAKKPSDNAVVRLQVGRIRDIKPLRVEHTPEFPTNRAHSEVFDLPKAEALVEVRVRLRRISELAISLQS